MTGWEALELARKYEGLEFYNQELDDYLMFSEGGAYSRYNGVPALLNAISTIKLELSDWQILNCHHPLSESDIGSLSDRSKRYCGVCSDYINK